MKIIKVAFTVIIASLYLFPIIISFLPWCNSKLMLAVVGMGLLVYDAATNRVTKSALNDSMVLSLLALIVSFCGLFSVVFNNTMDYSYAGYIFSMWVWLAAAYFVVRLINNVHGKINFRLVANYMIAVCIFQCLAAIMNDNIPAFKKMVDTYVFQGQDFINSLPGIKRKYGIGANLDTAGVRFSAILILIPATVIGLKDELKRKWLWAYALSFIFITVEGNIIARTTLVGACIGLAYAVFNLKKLKSNSPNFNSWMSLTFALTFGLILIGGIYYYNISESFRYDLRFGFEGLFSLVENGEWAVSSNDRLSNMYIWPDNLQTWLIGDGYFSNPINTDPYFIGTITGGYYMGTDVGFLRFIFYFGTIGLAAFVIFFAGCSLLCSKEYPRHHIFFILLVILGYIVWFKVATDIFLIFALFLAASILRKSSTQEIETCI